MSYILIDAGNSSLKLSVLDSADNLEIYFTILDYSDLYHNLIEQLSEFIVSNVIISNVNKAMVSHIVTDVSLLLWNVVPYQVVTQQNKYGISTRYSNPRLLGCDRWLALIAARAEFQKAICVVDCGTAVTIDVLTEEGMHIGGFITPGLDMSRNALGYHTNNLPLILRDEHIINDSSSFLANNTQDAIIGGTLYQLSAYLERVVAEIKQEVGNNIECIITGGDAVILQELISHHFSYREKLVLDGLAIIARDLFTKESL